MTEIDRSVLTALFNPWSIPKTCAMPRRSTLPRRTFRIRSAARCRGARDLIDGITP